MSNTPDRRADALDEGALLAAYLDGDTDDMTTARIERRLADDDEFAARLDAVAGARGRLQRLSEAEAPPQVTQRLRERLAAEGVGLPPADRLQRRGVRRARRWRTGPAAAAAAVAVLAIVGLGAIASSFGGVGGSAEGEAGGVAEAGEDTAVTGDAGALAADPAPDDERATSSARTTDGGAQAAAAPAPVDSDADIAARARRQADRGLGLAELRARERRLRRRSELPTTRLCVRDLEARAVDLVDEDGRVSLVVALGGADAQIVLLDPRTCVPVRTITDGN